jgi:hypothetical protein
VADAVAGSSAGAFRTDPAEPAAASCRLADRHLWPVAPPPEAHLLPQRPLQMHWRPAQRPHQRSHRRPRPNHQSLVRRAPE